MNMVTITDIYEHVKRLIIMTGRVNSQFYTGSCAHSPMRSKGYMNLLIFRPISEEKGIHLHMSHECV